MIWPILSLPLSQVHSITSENDRDYELITNIQQKLIFDKITPSKSTGEILHVLMQELNQLKAELTGNIAFCVHQRHSNESQLYSIIYLFDSVAVHMTTSREISRIGSASGKKKVLLSRAPRRRKRDDIPLARLSSSGSLQSTDCSIDV